MVFLLSHSLLSNLDVIAVVCIYTLSYKKQRMQDTIECALIGVCDCVLESKVGSYLCTAWPVPLLSALYYVVSIPILF